MKTITVKTEINCDVEKVWEYWTNPKHITGWAFASEDWECPYAENDVTDDGKFITRMSAKDGSASFDLSGTYTHVEPLEVIEYTLDDGREVKVIFEKTDDDWTTVTEEFEMEDINSKEKQYDGWQAILENFKYYVEHN